ncbi:MAG: AMP-binding protein [Saprospiraceae bacterium]
MTDPRLHEDLITPIEYFYQHEKNKPNAPFLKQPEGDKWHVTTFKEAGQQARSMVNALRNMGLKKGDHIAIISKNCAHWVMADIAIMMGGYVSTPFYPNLASDQLQTVLEISECKAAFVGKFDTWDNIDGGLPADFPIIKFPHLPGSAKVTRGLDWNDLVAQNEPVQENYIPNIKDMWSILFTSGTTGTPKGVVHDYENAALIARNEKLTNTLKAFTTRDAAFFSFLPLNHIAERAAVELGSLMGGAPISFAESLDTFAKNLQDTQPTFFFAVPRIWTKFQLGILSKMPQKKLNRLLSIPIVSSLVKKKIKKGLGLSRANTTLTGASITPESTKQFFRKLGINLREVYGMTENFGGFSLMPENGHKPNTIGKPFPNCAAKIDPNTGEIMMSVPYVMKGYYKEPELTAKVFDDGWLRTGDKGLMDEDGYLKIVGRVKDAFKTSKGKFIVPTILEDKFSGNDLIEQICVAGLGVPQPIALVNLSEIGQKEDQAAVTAKLNDTLKEVNSHLHGHEVISTIIVAKEPWTPENNLLTPTLKIRRGAIDERFMGDYQSWHDEKDKVLWV